VIGVPVTSQTSATVTPPADSSTLDARRSLRDMQVLVSLPGRWVDHEPQEIATGLLGVLAGVLHLRDVYVRFDASDGRPAIEAWAPDGPRAPTELLHVLVANRAPESGMETWNVDGGPAGELQVVGLRLELPWHNGLVLLSTPRNDFPTLVESRFLRAAVSQAAIAIHAARRLSRERKARTEAENQLSRQNEILRSLVDDVAPSLTSLSRRVHEVSQQVPEVIRPTTPESPRRPAVEPAAEDAGTPAKDRSPLPISHRELEVLGLLARGLSNKEIAGVMWLSDRTVERHITSLYRKIGVARRSEATAFALRHGVV
jgi:DNA-binding NarL/FixJ family response regulator